MVDHVILQTILSDGQIAEDKLLERYGALCSKFEVSPAHDFDEQLVHINVTLDHVGFGLRKLRNEFENGDWWFYLVNREGGSSLSSRVALYLKEVIKAFFDSDHDQGLPLAALPRNVFDKTNSSEYVKMLCVQGWLISKGDRIYVSPRTLLELEPWIKENFEGDTLFKCSGCGQWLIKGRHCANKQCKVRLHDHCFEAFFELGGRQEGTCPECGDRL